MKKFIMLFVFLFLLISTYSLKPIFYEISKINNVIFGESLYCYYCLGVNENISSYAEIIDNGNSYIVKTTINNKRIVKENISEILGESIKIKTPKTTILKIINYYNINEVKEENVGDIYSFYGYSKNIFQNYVFIDEKPVNIQLAYSDGYLTIGNPIILGEY